MDEPITAIVMNFYAGYRACMGYPNPHECDNAAEYDFDTPETVIEHNPKAAKHVYVCSDCLEKFMADIAIGVVFYKNS